jgi:hypothetical protein
VLAANDVTVLVDADDRYTPDPAGLSRDHQGQRRTPEPAPAWPTASW